MRRSSRLSPRTLLTVHTPFVFLTLIVWISVKNTAVALSSQMDFYQRPLGETKTVFKNE